MGCGGNLLTGWLNTDIGTILNRRGVVYLDARKRLPFADNMLRFIFNEHFISCLTVEEAGWFLKECHRVLKLGGILRIATPTWLFLVKLSKNRDEQWENYLRWATDQFLPADHYTSCFVINNLLYDPCNGLGGKSVYDQETLTWMLSQAGFSRVDLRSVGESPHPELRGVEGHGKVIPPEFNELETTVLEATKA